MFWDLVAKPIHSSGEVCPSCYGMLSCDQGLLAGLSVLMSCNIWDGKWFGQHLAVLRAYLRLPDSTGVWVGLYWVLGDQTKVNSMRAKALTFSLSLATCDLHKRTNFQGHASLLGPTCS